MPTSKITRSFRRSKTSTRITSKKKTGKSFWSGRYKFLDKTSSISENKREKDDALSSSVKKGQEETKKNPESKITISPSKKRIVKKRTDWKSSSHIPPSSPGATEKKKSFSTPKKNRETRGKGRKTRSKSTDARMTPSSFSSKSPAIRTQSMKARGKSVGVKIGSRKTSKESGKKIVRVTDGSTTPASSQEGRATRSRRQQKITGWLSAIKKKASEMRKQRNPRRRSSSGTCIPIGDAAKRALRTLARRAGVTEKFGEMAYGQLSCHVCSSSEDDENMVLCDRCDKGFHLYCLRPQLAAVPVGDWFCPDCTGESIAKIQDDFEAEKRHFRDNVDDLVKFLKLNRFEEKSLDHKTKRSIVGGKCTSTKSNFRVHSSTADTRQRLEQLASLAAALKVKSIEYITQLAYTVPEKYGPKPRHNNVAREPMQTLTQQNHRIYTARESLRSLGYCVPVRIEYDAVQGFVAIADGTIKDRTLICEYVGEVGFLSDHQHDDCDSIMDLLRTGKSRTSLVITPKRMSNMARFLSGINNHCSKSKRRQNVRSARFAIGGKSHVLLFAARNITKGEHLHYDYNALDKSGYPTAHFS
eukprot:g4964.t1